MAREVVRRLRHAVRREVVRRADGRHAHAGADPHGNHVFRDLLAQAHGRVETLRHEIDQRRLHRQLEFDVGIVPREPFDGGPQEGLGGVLRRRDADGSSRLLAKLGEHRELGIDLVEGWPQALDQQFARVRRRNVAVVRVRRRA